jgi:hypothetical protein
MYNTPYKTTSLANTSPTEEQIVSLLREYWSGERKVALKALKGFGGNYTCIYEDAEGNRCVIGNFLSDNSPALQEELGIYRLFETRNDLLYLVKHCSLRFLEIAQECHDSLNPDIYTPRRFINALRKLKSCAKNIETRKLITTLIVDVEQEP